MNRKLRRSNKTLMFPILLLLIAVILIAFGSSLFIESESAITQLDDGWSVSYGGNTYTDVTLSEFNFGKLKKDDLIILSNTLPAQDLYAPTIMFKSSVSAIDVTIDTKYSYTYGHVYDDLDKLVPKKIHLITLDDMASEHSIEIMCKITESNIFKYMFPIYIGNKRDLIKDFLQRQRLSIFVGGFMIMYSCILVSLWAYLSVYRRNNRSLICSSIISLVFGTYTYAYKDIFCIISDRDYFFTLLEYISLYLTPLSVSLLLYVTHPTIANIRQRIFLMVNTAIPAITVLLHVFGVVHICTFVNLIQITASVEMILILPPLISGMDKEHKEKMKSVTYTGVDADYYLLFGFIILILFSMVEIVKFNIVKYKTFSDNIIANINFLTVGALYFIICLFIYYFFHGIDRINTQFMKEHLEGLAYTDALTGLMNRGKCMQYMASVRGPYAIVNLDLDRLKYVNDNFGHIEGDKMIKAFAELLAKSFDTASIIGRTGGDEFLVAIENPSATICDESIRKLELLISDFNKNSSENFSLSVSAGYAYSYEDPEGKFENVFYLADTRMYKMKEQHHA